MNVVIGIILIIVLIACIISIAAPLFYFLFIAGSIYIVYLIFESMYFKGKKFSDIKANIANYVEECNELNSHIEDLKSAYIGIKHTDYGNASYNDNSIYKFKRPKLNKIKQEHNTYQCSLSVCKNAQQQPFKYVCKYFNIEANEETLNKFEEVFNDFAAAEQGKELLKEKKEEIICSISTQIPFIIRKFRKKTLSRKLGFEDIDFSNLYFPKYTFQYVSGGGNSSMHCDIIFDLDNLERFINYLSEIIRSKKSIAGQRALMTSQLREKIKIRDNYTCQKCGLSISDEPHLLLEIDHIVPLSKNGLTVEDNLQTLCWKCNRKKGAKVD